MSRDLESDSREILKLLLHPPKFKPGQIVATQGAVAKLKQGEITKGLSRHLRGDWGEVDEEDREANEFALLDGDRLLSVYTTPNGVCFWIITEADRSATTVLLPEEY